MRTLVDIPDRQIDELAMICAANKISRAEVIRRAIASYIEKNRLGTDEAFGIFKAPTEDGLAFQNRVRFEW